MAGQASETADRYGHVAAVLECSVRMTGAFTRSCVAYVQYQITTRTSSLYEMIALNEPANIAFGTDLKAQPLA